MKITYDVCGHFGVQIVTEDGRRIPYCSRFSDGHEAHLNFLSKLSNGLFMFIEKSFLYFRSSLREYDGWNLLDVLSSEHGKQISSLLFVASPSPTNDRIVTPASREASQFQFAATTVCTISPVPSWKVSPKVPPQQPSLSNIWIPRADARLFACRAVMVHHLPERINFKKETWHFFNCVLF